MVANNINKGTILLVTLWILAILSLLAIGIGFRTTIDLKLVGYQIDNLKAYEVAKAGILKAINELGKDETPAIDTILECGITLKENETFDEMFRDTRNTTLGDGHFYISYIEDIERKININTVDVNSPDPIILKALSSGITPEIAANIKAWRGEGQPSPGSYAGKNYTSKRAAFDTTEELLLVEGVTRDIYYGNEGGEAGIKDLITVYPKDLGVASKVNINTASQRVLEVLFEAAGFDKSIAGKIVDDRDGPDGDITTKGDNAFCQRDDTDGIKQFIIDEAGPTYRGIDPEVDALTKLCPWLTIKSSYFEIRSVGSLEGKKSNIKKTITCVVKRTGSGATYETEIISWFEE